MFLVAVGDDGVRDVESVAWPQGEKVQGEKVPGWRWGEKAPGWLAQGLPVAVLAGRAFAAGCAGVAGGGPREIEPTS
jgi:hypothetical protein